MHECLFGPEGAFAPDLKARTEHLLSASIYHARGGEGTRPLNQAFDETCMGHLELAALGKSANVKNLVISHVTEQMDVSGVRERIIADMAQIYSGNIFFGEDLMEIPVIAPAPAKLN